MTRLLRFAAGAFSVVVALAGCGDGTSPEVRGAAVRIHLDGVPYEEQTVAVGSVVQLTALVFDPAGRPLEGERVEWRSLDAAVASVGAGGEVRANEPGRVGIVATNPAGADTAMLNVAVPIARDQLPGCAGRPLLQLAPGETRTLAGAEALAICFAAAPAEAEYTMAVVNSGATAAAVIDGGLVGRGLAEPGLAARATRSPDRTRSAPLPDPRFHLEARERSSRELEWRLRSADRAGTLVPRADVAVGARLELNVNAADACTNPRLRTGIVRAVTERAIIVADEANPAGGFTDPEYEALGAFFDEEAWPLVTGAFGTPSDEDENGRVIIFFTRAVNELRENDPRNSNSYVAGYFFNRDLFARSACEGSNEGEMMYVLVPEPAPPPERRAFSKSFVSRVVRNVLIHEFQHLVNDSRRLHINRSPVWEETWLNEGLSHIAEELMFYRAAGLAPGQNLDAGLFESERQRSAYFLFQLDNHERFHAFLRAPAQVSPAGTDDVRTRGATWSLLRYAADRYTGGEDDLWRALSGESTTAGFENLQRALRVEPADLISGWAGTLLLDDTPSEGGEYQLESWNYRAIFPVAGQVWPGVASGAYPLPVEPVGNAEPLRFSLQGGAAAFARARATAGDGASVHLFIGGEEVLPAPSRLRVIVTRSR